MEHDTANVNHPQPEPQTPPWWVALGILWTAGLIAAGAYWCLGWLFGWV